MKDLSFRRCQVVFREEACFQDIYGDNLSLENTAIINNEYGATFEIVHNNWSNRLKTLTTLALIFSVL